MLVLAIDTAASRAAVAIQDMTADRELGRAVEAMQTGYAERLMGLLSDALAQAGVALGQIGLVAVSVGPGSFTGVRVGVATARGLALALDIPAAGVSTLQALAAEARAEAEAKRPVLAVLQAGRDMVFAAAFGGDGRAIRAPAALTLNEAVRWADELRPVLAGTAAERIKEGLPHLDLPIGPLAATADIAVFARLAPGLTGQDKPKPLYLRAPDAKPQAGFTLARRA